MESYRSPRERALHLDEQDNLKHFCQEFFIPTVAQAHSNSITSEDGDETTGVDKRSIYLCGNSLGLQPRRTATRLQQYLSTWASQGVQGHFKLLPDSPLPTWLDADARAANMMAPIVGCDVSEVAVMQTLTANLHLLLSAFYCPQIAGRHKIIIESKAFPSDYFAAESQVRQHGLDPKTSILAIDLSQSGSGAGTTNSILSAISEHASSVSVLLLPGIQYYTGELLDIRTITHFARQHGIFVLWDLAHAVGNVPLQLHNWDVDAAVWCSYKYLNSGPGGIGGLYVHSRHTEVAQVVTNGSPTAAFVNRLAGWWGNDKSTRFSMSTSFFPVAGAAGFQLSNPSILDITSLCASLEVFQEAGGVDILRKKSVGLTAFLEDILLELPEATRREFRIITPSHPEQRGAQLSLLLADGLLGPVMDALFARSVIVDDRKPNVIRIAPTPLYNTYTDCVAFVAAFEQAVAEARGIPGISSE